MSTQKLIKEPKFLGAMAILTIAIGAFAFLNQVPKAEADTLAPSVLIQPPQQHALVADTTPAPATPAKAEEAPAAKEVTDACALINTNPDKSWVDHMKATAEVTKCKLYNMFSHKEEPKHEGD